MGVDAIEQLRVLTGKKHVFLVDRGNSAIFLCLKLVKSLDKKRIIIQDQGGWITYPQFIKRLKLQEIRVKTDYGILNPDSLCKGGEVLLINSLSGYFAEQPMEEIEKACKKNDVILINDASGSVGTSNAKIGDIILGSFGEGKPVNLGYGGFIAADNPDFIRFFEENFNKGLKDNFQEDLVEALNILDKRLNFFYRINKKIKLELKDYNILHKDSKGINVVIGYHTEEEKNSIISYCTKNDYPYTECPRYIRVTENAISIEVKRLSF